jgi:hypothetical protein
MNKRPSVVSLRLNTAELQYVDEIAEQKGVTRSEACREIFLQKIALQEIEKSVATIVLSGVASMQKDIASLRLELAQSLQKDDLVKATNFIIKEVKK